MKIIFALLFFLTLLCGCHTETKLIERDQVLSETIENLRVKENIKFEKLYKDGYLSGKFYTDIEKEKDIKKVIETKKFIRKSTASPTLGGHLLMLTIGLPFAPIYYLPFENFLNDRIYGQARHGLLVIKKPGEYTDGAYKISIEDTPDKSDPKISEHIETVTEKSNEILQNVDVHLFLSEKKIDKVKTNSKGEFYFSIKNKRSFDAI